MGRSRECTPRAQRERVERDHRRRSEGMFPETSRYMHFGVRDYSPTLLADANHD
jgi:hypothetical protein